MEKLTADTEPGLGSWKIPRDGTCRYLYDAWQPLALFVLTVCFTAIFYSVYTPFATIPANDLFYCNADGNLVKADGWYRPLWDPELYFTVNIAFGKLAFSTAKIIDAVWDAVVARGGQMLAATVAYRTLRRSLTLTMEASIVTMPTVATLYCHQIQIVSLRALLHEIFLHRGSPHPQRRRPTYLGKIRLLMQAIACLYVLSFVTLLSVTTGYRAQLSGYYGYDADNPSQLQPVGEISRPSMVVYNGSRVGLSDSPIYAREQVRLPVERLDPDSQTYKITDLIDKSQDFEEPYGVFFDYYYTCLGVIYWATSAPPANMTPFTLRCARHDCSCTTHDVDSSSPYGLPLLSDRRELMLPKVTSNITIDGKLWELSAPPLTIGLATLIYSSPRRDPATTLDNSIDFWAEATTFPYSSPFNFNGRQSSPIDVYWNNGTVLDARTIQHTGRCVSEDAYQWGFSSLLLLTFCSATIAFAVVLILLQTDVYWNSRSDRSHQSHSLYADILYLAEELKAFLGRDPKETAPSPEALRRNVERRKQGLRLAVDELPVSRWQERRLSRAAGRAAARKKGTATRSTGSLTRELSALSARDAEQGPEDVGLHKGLDSAVHEEGKLEEEDAER